MINYSIVIMSAQPGTKKEDITAKIKIIDHTQSEAMAKADSLKQAPAIHKEDMMLE